MLVENIAKDHPKDHSAECLPRENTSMMLG